MNDHLTEKHVAIQKLNKDATEDMSRRVRDRLRRFRDRNSDCLPDSEGLEAPCTLSVDSTLAHLKELAEKARNAMPQSQTESSASTDHQ